MSWPSSAPAHEVREGWGLGGGGGGGGGWREQVGGALKGGKWRRLPRAHSPNPRADPSTHSSPDPFHSTGSGLLHLGRFSAPLQAPPRFRDFLTPYMVCLLVCVPPGSSAPLVTVSERYRHPAPLPVPAAGELCVAVHSVELRDAFRGATLQVGDRGRGHGGKY